MEKWVGQNEGMSSRKQNEQKENKELIEDYLDNLQFFYFQISLVKKYIKGVKQGE